MNLRPERPRDITMEPKKVLETFPAVSACRALRSQEERLAEATRIAEANFVAINYITCKPHYAERFECLFCSRARAIDTMPGFCGMRVLKCTDDGQPYLVISYWDSEEHFRAWVGSPEFLEGHKRGFEDLRAAKERGEEPPMTSDFKTYAILTD